MHSSIIALALSVFPVDGTVLCGVDFTQFFNDFTFKITSLVAIDLLHLTLVSRVVFSSAWWPRSSWTDFNKWPTSSFWSVNCLTRRLPLCVVGYRAASSSSMCFRSLSILQYSAIQILLFITLAVKDWITVFVRTIHGTIIKIWIEIDNKKRCNWYNWIYNYIDTAVAYFTLTKLPKRL